MFTPDNMHNSNIIQVDKVIFRNTYIDVYIFGM